MRDAIGQDRLQAWFARILAKKAVLMFDTCEAGSLTERAKTRGGLEQKTALGRLIQATGRATLTASTATQEAYEGHGGHGVFTFALLDALARADTNGNGLVELAELIQHVVDGACLCHAQPMLDLGEDLLDRIEVWLIGRQEREFGSGGEDGIADRPRAMAAEIVEDDDIAGAKRRHQELSRCGTFIQRSGDRRQAILQSFEQTAAVGCCNGSAVQSPKLQFAEIRHWGSRRKTAT